MLTPVSAQAAPTTTVRITSATIVSDAQHAVLRVAAASGVTGESTISVTARDASNQTAVRKFGVNVVADTLNDRAFLGRMANEFGMRPNTPLSINLPGTDLENDSLTYVVRDANDFNLQPTNFTVNVDQVNHRVTLTPKSSFQQGSAEILLGVRDQTRRTDTNNDGMLTDADSLDVLGNFDTQKVKITITNFSFTNAASSRDVDHNGIVAAHDAVLVINEIVLRNVSDPLTGQLPVPTSQPTNFLDVDGDGLVILKDALLVINAVVASRAPIALSVTDVTPDFRYSPTGAVVNPSLDTGYADWNSTELTHWRQAVDNVWRDWTDF
jgi:hypothetical protein